MLLLQRGLQEVSHHLGEALGSTLKNLSFGLPEPESPGIVWPWLGRCVSSMRVPFTTLPFVATIAAMSSRLTGTASVLLASLRRAVGSKAFACICFA